VNDTTYPTLRLSTATSYSNIYHDGTTGSIVYSADDGGAIASSSHQFYVDGSERMRIDSSGQITNTMSGGKVLTDTNGHITSFQTLDTQTAGGRFIGKSNRGVLGSIHIEQTTTGADGGYIGFETSPNGSTTPTERMRIDSSGNVLVGKTTADFGATQGVELRSTGNSYFTGDGANALRLNRLSSDGDLLTFRKDGTTVGQIGAIAGLLTLGSNNNVALTFTSSSIRPSNNDGSGRDNAIDLGQSGNRFNDLYLGGSVYLGGTTSANALDDYEEGTFTPTIHAGASNISLASNNYGKYTKVGNVVHCSGRFQASSLTAGSSSTNVELGGLPFAANTPLGTSTGAVAGSIGFAGGFAGEAATMMQIRDGETNAFLYYQNSSLTVSNVKGNDLGSTTTIVFQITYHV